MTRTSDARFLLVAGLFALLFADPAGATVLGVDGSLPPEVVQAFSSGLFQVPARPALSTTAAQTDWLLPIIMVNFPDSTLRYSGPTLQAALFDTTQSTATGSIVDYYNWVSNGAIHVRGEVVATVMMPHEAGWYANYSYGLNVISTPQNDWGLVHDAVGLADPSVDWNRYDRDGDGYVDMLWIVHPGVGAEASGSRGSFWSVTTAMAGPWSNGGVYETKDLVAGSTTRYVRINRFSMLPELSPFHPGQLTEIGIFCHEFGHALGLPDLYDTSSLGGSANIGPGCWSLMASGEWGGDGRSPQYPTHPGAWCMLYLNLASLVQPAQDTTVVIPPISSGGPVYEYFFQGAYNSEHFLLEQRCRQGFDRNLPADGLIISQVDDAVIGVGLWANRVNAGPTPGLRVLEADAGFDMYWGTNRGDAGDPVPGATNTTFLNDDTNPPLRMFSGAVTNLVMEGMQAQGNSTRVRLHVRAMGWYPIEDFTDPAYSPTMGLSRGHHAVVSSVGDEYEVFSDSRSGVSQVMLRWRAFGGWWWSPATTISASSTGAYNPTIAILPGDGLAVAWEDVRDGTSQIYYRCRIGGAWSPERRLSSNPGSSAAIAADRAGHVHLCWSDPGPPWPRIDYLTFPAGNPGGTPLVASDSLGLPSAPSIAATRMGGAWILWPDLGSGNYVIRFARWTPDSGMFPSQPLTLPVTYPQPSVDAIADSSGTVHVVWQQSGVSAYELHYQRRGTFVLDVPDTTIVSASQTVQYPSLATDRAGGIHLAYERSTTLGQMVRYKRWRPGYGWDYASTDVSDPTQGSAGRVGVVALTPGDVSIVYSSSRTGAEQLRERRRRLDATPLAAPQPALARVPAFHVGPSPLLAGRELVVSGTALAGASVVELYDASGRRVASAPAASGAARFSPEQTRALRPGLYFTRVRGGGSQRLVVIR